MDVLVPLTVDDLIPFLNDSLEIEVLDWQKLESGGEGYIVIYVSNLDETQESLLMNFGFEQVNDDILIHEGFEVDLDSTKELVCEFYKEEESKKWLELTELRSRVDSIHQEKTGEPVFKTTHNTPKLMLSWYGIVTPDESSFNHFLSDFYKLFIDEINQNFFKIANESNFYVGVRCLRNIKSHDSTKNWQIQTANKYLETLIGVSFPNQWFQYLTLQVRIIEDGIEFLNGILEIK